MAGPFRKSETQYLYDAGGFKYPVFYYDRIWNTQKRPYKHAMAFAYENFRYQILADRSDGGSASPNQIGFMDPSDAINSSYEQLTNGIGEQSQFANNLLEAKESIGMIESRGLQIVKSLRSLRKGNVAGAISALGSPQPTRGQKNALSRAKSVSDQWLELHFGWVPLIQDIHAASNTLSKTDFGSRRITGSGNLSAQSNERVDNSPSNFERNSVRQKVNVRQVCRIRVSNPNAFLANQFGVVNPASVAWEAVPYSFVVDWFANVGQCLNAMTDFVGLTVEDAFVTTFWQNSFDHSVQYLRPQDFQYSHSDRTTQVRCVRGFGVQGPVLKLKPFKGLSVTRGATAIALVLQHL